MLSRLSVHHAHAKGGFVDVNKASGYLAVCARVVADGYLDAKSDDNVG
jgi:hypothetical protein